MRIYIFTDSHLGFKERDEVLGNDSFQAFEEGLYYAQQMKCDLALHAGDLFDVQKPSQSTMHKAMTILARYCLNGPRESSAEPMSVIQRHIPGHIYNLEQDHMKTIPLPLFMIYGNHDPPVTHHDGHVVAPVDVLEAAHLVNVLGKNVELDPITVQPVVLRCGNIKLAVYGIGYIRDERVNRLFELGKIHFVPPPDSIVLPDGKVSGTSCFCVLLIHQNRYKGQVSASGVPAKRCVHEHMLPTFLDLVVWGHEHDCDIELRNTAGNEGVITGDTSTQQGALASYLGNMKITQPGSSVYTSMRKGEATLKRNAIVEIKGGKAFHFFSFPLLSPRPFVFRQVNIFESELDLKERLSEETVEALDEAQKFYEEKDTVWKRSMEKISDLVVSLDKTEMYIKVLKIIGLSAFTEKLPLVRLRVEIPYSCNTDGFSCTRFTMAYQNKIANCDDMILMTRAMKRNNFLPIADALPDDCPKPIDEVPEADPEEAIFDNVKEITNLKLLSVTLLNECVKKYVDRSDLNAFEDVISNTYTRAIQMLKAANVQGGDIGDYMAACKESMDDTRMQENLMPDTLLD